MSDSKKCVSSSIDEIQRLTESIIKRVAVAQREYVAEHYDETNTFAERVAMWCAFEALARTFSLEGVVDDPESLECIEEFVSLIEIKKSPAAPADYVGQVVGRA